MLVMKEKHVAKNFLDPALCCAQDFTRTTEMAINHYQPSSMIIHHLNTHRYQALSIRIEAQYTYVSLNIMIMILNYYPIRIMAMCMNTIIM